MGRLVSVPDMGRRIDCVRWKDILVREPSVFCAEELIDFAGEADFVGDGDGDTRTPERVDTPDTVDWF
jgi:hypothetical protein